MDIVKVIAYSCTNCDKLYYTKEDALSCCKGNSPVNLGDLI